ncbi:2-polyprenyl-6-methoxyphenol hydroxylase-like FAD-dependent oxidoreductase [Saccharothrix tamanrassetensis]|uniref:2-polyprenyl-6-methoxyphenol hydroxylase-like FAD-dependent oxidoreductase n=1 Tax=Saccharothrix tamanrassetensis TaxID=1051531 RepID=A0A841CCL6_9PSEU|nr:FAD-dependent monooxygenase [Saccharothrix tamanrassetensis]MBB5953496.1 2-polyprenyl-6-methoxyphenol hydroxylase-like FAD-dependent oxidoreductase [Saccharothrix tamanrassetensis]
MKVVICGAGIAGLTLAGRLAAAGHPVVVVEKSAGPRPEGYMIDFFGPGYDAAERMGLLPRFHELGYRFIEAGYHDETGRRRAGLNFARFAESMGGRMTSIMRPDVEHILRTDLPPEVTLRFGAGVVAVDNRPDGVSVALSDGTSLDADLLVGADGIHSTVRRLVFGDEQRFFRYLGFHTAAFTVTDPEIHRLVEGRFCLTDTVGRQVGCYGLRDGWVAAFTVHRTPDPTLPTDPRASVRAAYGTLGWIVPRVLERCPPEIYYDQVAQIELPRWSAGRVVLVGDACGAVSLLAGQGASLGMGGAFVLAGHLDDLDGYERRWRPVVAEKQRIARSGARWFLPATALRLHVRRWAMRLARVPWIDRRIATSLVGKPTALVGD